MWEMFVAIEISHNQPIHCQKCGADFDQGDLLFMNNGDALDPNFGKVWCEGCLGDLVI